MLGSQFFLTTREPRTDLLQAIQRIVKLHERIIKIDCFNCETSTSCAFSEARCLPQESRILPTTVGLNGPVRLLVT